MKFITLTKYSTTTEWEDKKSSVTVKLSPVRVNAEQIQMIQTGSYYRGGDNSDEGGPEYIDKTLITFGVEMDVFVNESVDEVLRAIQYADHI